MIFIFVWHFYLTSYSSTAYVSVVVDIGVPLELKCVVESDLIRLS